MAIDIGPKIGINGEKEFRQNLNNINQQLRTLGSEMKAVTSAFSDGDDSEKKLAEQTRVLNAQIDKQEEKLEELRKGLERSTQKYGEADSKTLKWKQAVYNATTELNRMKSRLNKTEGELDDFGDAAKKATGDVSDLEQAVGKGLRDTLAKGIAAGTIVAGLKEIGQAIMDVEENTREFRSIMGGLEVSSQNAGFTTEQTALSFERLYGVLGDEQTAATTLANLQAIGLQQSALTPLIDAVTGAWSKYGDSIPIDGLAESINETIKAGQVTGTFADVLNWAGTSEDEFNEKLKAANDSTERANVVAQELANQGLVQAGQAWRDVNADVVEANESQLRYREAAAGLGEALAPAANFMRDTLASAFEWATEKVGEASEALEELKGWWGRTKEAWRELTSGGFSGVWDRITSIDGSHANGLGYVPYDGYVAQLHQGEMVLTAAQANAIRGGAQDYSGLTSGIVNAMSTLNVGAYVPELRIKLVTRDNQVMAEWLQPAMRNIDKSNPEVVSDPL